MNVPMQCTSCEHRFETIGAAGEHVDCPMCGTELTLPSPTSMRGKLDLTIPPEQVARALEQVAEEARAEEPRVPENGGLYSGMTAREVARSQAEAAEILARDRAAETELPPPGATPYVSVNMTLPVDVTALGAQRAAVALFVGGYVEAVLDGTTGAEVRVRRRGDSVQLVANRFIPGGRRIEDSQMVHERELFDCRIPPLDMGRERGEQVAAMIRVATGEDRPE